ARRPIGHLVPVPHHLARIKPQLDFVSHFQLHPPDTANLPSSLLYEWNVIVFADTLKHQKRCRAIPAIDDKMWAARLNRISLTRAKPHLLLRLAQEHPDVSFDNVKRILNIAVVMPRH